MHRSTTVKRLEGRVEQLLKGFPDYVKAFATAKLFTGPSLHFHERTLQRLRDHQSAVRAVRDEQYLEALYATLTATLVAPGIVAQKLPCVLVKIGERSGGSTLRTESLRDTLLRAGYRSRAQPGHPAGDLGEVCGRRRHPWAHGTHSPSTRPAVRVRGDGGSIDVATITRPAGLRFVRKKEIAVPADDHLGAGSRSS